MHRKEIVRHVIPQVGFQEITLYPPAGFIYKRLRETKEIQRLNNLLHLGALSSTFPGIRQARWDYTVAMLYYCNELQLPGMKTKFKIGRVEFSSAIAALQTIILMWNIGHLPGTFSVEKGVIRFANLTNPEEPAGVFLWPDDLERTKIIRNFSNRYLRHSDYLGLASILAIIKALTIANEKEDGLRQIVDDFIGPFFIHVNYGNSSQWVKIRRAFRIIRHLAYLTLDSPFTGLQWSPGIPSFFQQTVTTKSLDLNDVDAQVSEVLSPIERATYETIYHSPNARGECAIVSEWVFQHLTKIQNPSEEILRWMNCAAFDELNLGENTKSDIANRIATVRLRSHFVFPSKPPADLEKSLKQKGFTLPTVFKYSAWNSDKLFEPDEIIIDAITSKVPSTNQVGKLILWIISEFEVPHANYEDYLSVLRKNDLENTYISLLSRAVQLKFGEIDVQVDPWPLKEFGIFPNTQISERKGAIWASPSRLDDPFIRHIVYKRNDRIPDGMQDQYAELLGIRELRLWLRKQWKRKELRQRWLVVTGSVQFQNNSRRLIEFDGGLMKISTRSGHMTWYGLESKRGGGSPYHSLNRRLKTLKIGGNIHLLTSRYAVLELEL